MLVRFLKWLFTSPAPVTAPAPVAAPRDKGMFSTDHDDEPDPTAALIAASMRAQRLQDVVFGAEGSRAIDKVRLWDAKSERAGTLATFAQDDATGGSSLKAAYALGAYGVPDSQAAWYGSQGFIGYQMCAIIAQHWLVAKACAVPARDAVRKGYRLASNDGSGKTVEILAAIEKADKRFKLKSNMVEFVQMGRVFGIRVAMFKVNSTDPDYYVKPFNPDGVLAGTYEGIAQIDPYWVVPELTTSAAMDPTSIDFYEPSYWIVNGKRVHKSHLVIFRGEAVADIFKPSYLFGGISVPQRIYERVYAAERCANEAPQLMLTKRSTVFYTDTEKALTQPIRFAERMQKWTSWLTSYGIKVASKDADKIEQHDTSLTDLDDNIMTQYQLVAAAANIPATKLMGTTPKGFNSTGSYEESSYHEELESIQANDLTRLMERHHACVIRSLVMPAFSIEKPFTVDVVWAPLDSPTAKELAETNKLKSDTDKVLVECGAIDGADVRARIAKDPDSGYDGIAVLESADDDPTPQNGIQPLPGKPAPVPFGGGA